MSGKLINCILFDSKAFFCLRMSKTCLMLALALFLVSCSPIWYKMKRRAEAEVAARASLSNKILLASDDFRNVSVNWVAESEDKCDLQYIEADTCLDIKASKGLTLWYKNPFEGDICIKYEACVVDQKKVLDRVSDLNCFWMASDPQYQDDLFARTDFRKGVFGRYYSLQLYYLGFGGNSNTTTRFRRYDGNYDEFFTEMKRPEILFEYQDEAYLIKPNHWYSIEIKVKQGRVQYIQDGMVLIDYIDPMPLTKGWFGLRTTENHMRVRNFAVYRL